MSDFDLTNETLNLDASHGSIDLVDAMVQSLAKFNLERDGWEYPTREISLALGRRIVACVNACRGIETGLMEQMLTQSMDFAYMLAKARQYQQLAIKYNGDVSAILRERDEARAMVAELVAMLRKHEWGDSVGYEKIDQHTYCPECGNQNPEHGGKGHFGTCALVGLLTRAKAIHA